MGPPDKPGDDDHGCMKGSAKDRFALANLAEI